MTELEHPIADQESAELRLLSDVHSDMESKIASLQTALFTAIAALIASVIIGVLTSFDKIMARWEQALQYPTLLVLSVCLWAGGMVFVNLTAFIFMECVKFGRRVVQLERDKLGQPVRYGEIEEFIAIDEASWLQRLATRVYAPGLVCSGLCHRYFPMLLSITVLVGMASFAVHIPWCAHSIEPCPTCRFSLLAGIVKDHSILVPSLLLVWFYVTGIVVVPRLHPSSGDVTREIADARIVVVSETLSHLHGTEVAVIGFAKTAVRFGEKLVVVGPRQKTGGAVRQTCKESRITLVELPSVSTWFAGQPDFRVAWPFQLGLIISSKTKSVFINTFGPLGFLALRLARRREIRTVFFYHVYGQVHRVCPFVRQDEVRQRNRQ